MAEDLTGTRIVIAEDHDDTRYIVEHVLRHLGATVTGAATAREALGMMPMADIIVTDFSMPGHDGVWLLEQVNQNPRPLPVISVSGFAEQQVPRLAQAPFARKLLKPVDPWQLADVILEVVRASARSQLPATSRSNSTSSRTASSDATQRMNTTPQEQPTISR